MSDYYSSQASTGIYGALAKLMPGDRLIVDSPQTLAGPVKLAVPMTELLILQKLDGGTDVEIEVLADLVKVTARGAGMITNSLLSAVMVTAAGTRCTIDGLVVTGYNTKNATGHAGIFGYKAVDLTVINCRISDGNGNGVRTDGVDTAFIFNNRVARTHGASSEGITLGAKHVLCERNRVDRANVTGILVWAGPYEEIDIAGNTVSNSSQTAAGSHPGIGISLNRSQITGLRIEDNCCYDDQLSPTQSHAIAIYGPGSIAHGRVWGNMGWGNQASDPLTLVGAPDLTADCQAG
ncbi:MAG TPA: right-handed parallel beta-helix repeat-containing protein [Terriglobia bacterium]|nr:right-handed parallel beta-helix repeat-containing protein [Terriglobia bacterium]